MRVKDLGLCRKPLTRLQHRRRADDVPDEDDEVCFLGVVPAAPAAVLPPVTRKSKSKGSALSTKKTRKMKREGLLEAAKRARLAKVKGLKAGGGGGTGGDKCKTLSRPTDKTTTGVSTGVIGGTAVEKVTPTRSFKRYTCVTSSKRRKRMLTQKIQPLTLLPRHRQHKINPNTPLKLVPLKTKKSKKVSKAELNPFPRRSTRIPVNKLEDRYSHRRRKQKSPIVESVDTSTYSTLTEDGHGRRRLSTPVPTLMPPSSAPPEQLPISHSDHAIAAVQSTSAAPALPVSETRSVENAPGAAGDVGNATYCRGCFPLGPGHGYPIHVFPAGFELPSGIQNTMCKMSVRFLGPAHYLPKEPPWAEYIVQFGGKEFWLVPNTTFAVALVRSSVNKEAPVEMEQQPPESETDSTEDDVVQLPANGPSTSTTSSSNNEVRCLNCEMIVPATSMAIIDHTRKHHIRRGQKECPICKKKYSTKSYLLDHIKTHYQQLQEVCGQCGAGFASTFRLNRHVQTSHRYSTECPPPAPTKPEDFQVQLQPSSEFTEFNE